MMTNFDFLKNFNKELYEIGVKLEEDVIGSPRAVTADATVFLENLIKDIYRLSNKRIDKNMRSFYKKTDNLYRLGVISYIYKNKLQEAYGLRNKIHNESLESDQEKRLALDLDKRLYYIAKKYFMDFCGNDKYIEIPDYKKPEDITIHFDNCIICGSPNRKSHSNMCRACNQKIENANIMLCLKNEFNDRKFTRSDLVDFGISESKAILLLMDLSKFGAVANNGEFYVLRYENFDNYLREINKYIEVGLLITKFYREEVSTKEIIESVEYNEGRNNHKPYREFFKLANKKIKKDFERNLLKTKDIKKSVKISLIDGENLNNWYYGEKDDFSNGILNDAFILYNELLIEEFFKLKRRGCNDEDILSELDISEDIHNFWQSQFMAGRFFKKSRNIKKERILDEIKKNKSLGDALYCVGMSRRDFEMIYEHSKSKNDEFYKSFNRQYTQKRKKLLIRNLKKHNLNRAIRLTRITKKEFLKWYGEGEQTLSDFYLKVTQLLMEKYICYRRNDMDKMQILRNLNISKDMFNSWMKHDDHQLFVDFHNRNERITMSLIKRGMVINGIKDGKTKEEAIFSANLTPRQFIEIYNNSKREKTDFHLRFDEEYEKSRKRKFMKLIGNNDFYYSIQKCEMTQSEFNEWYFKDQDLFLATNDPSSFYLTSTCELMDKYLRARRDGKNKPDAAKSVGLSNTVINKWLNHPEYDLYNDFKRKNNDVTVDLIVDAFRMGKSKIEVCESCDIPISTIEEFIELGKNGLAKYEEMFELYEDRVIPLHLDIFLNDFKTKSFYKSLKHSKLDKKDIDYYYRLGKLGYEKFSGFYNDYLDIKIELYVKSIISKKSQKIALKNSNLSMDELKENGPLIEDLIFNARMDVIYDALNKNKSTGAKLAKASGIDVEEIYEWYFKGKRGDEKYREFSSIFEIEFILPRAVAFRKAKMFGIPKKILYKKIKKDLGGVDFKIWEKYDIFNMDLMFYDYENDTFEDEKIIEVLNKSEFYKGSNRNDFRIPKRRRKSFEDELKSIFNVSLTDKSEAVAK